MVRKHTGKTSINTTGRPRRGAQKEPSRPVRSTRSKVPQIIEPPSVPKILPKKKTPKPAKQTEQEKATLRQDILKEYAKELHKPALKHYETKAVVSSCPDDIWAMDLVQLTSFADDNDGYCYIMNVLDVFSRYVWAVPLKTKSAEEVLEAFKKVVKQNKNITPSYVWADQGTEFYNKKFKEYCKEHGITLYSTFGNHKSAMVERYNRTQKAPMWAYFTETQSKRWLEILPTLVKNYNSKIHRMIHMTPTEAHALKGDDILQLWTKQYGHLQLANTRPPKFKVGDWVRVSRIKGAFEKGYEESWSKAVYIVKKVHHTVPWTYSVEDIRHEEIIGTFYEPEMQKTVQDSFDKPWFMTVLRRREKDGKKQIFVTFPGYDDTFNRWLDEE